MPRSQRQSDAIGAASSSAGAGRNGISGGPFSHVSSAAILADALEQGREGVLVADASGRVLAANQTIVGWSGGHHDGLVGQWIWSVVGMFSEAGWPDVWRTLSELGLIEQEDTCRTADGRERPSRTLMEYRQPPEGAPRAILRIFPRVVASADGASPVGQPTGPMDWFRCVAEYSEDGYWDWNPLTGVISVSRQWCALFGLPVRSTITVDDLRRLMAPADFTRIMGESARIGRGEVERLETTVRVLRADGQRVWIRHRAYLASRTSDGRVARVVGRAMDITAERAAADDLRRLVERVPSAVMVYRPDGRVRLWNRAACEVLGCADEDFLAEVERRRSEGWGLVDERGEPVPREQLPSYVALTTGEAVHDRVMGLYPAGSSSLRWGLVSALPRVSDDGEVLDVVTTVADITDFKRLEAAYAHAQRLESLGRLAGGVAHDFNNLLTAVMGNAELIRMGLPPGASGLDELDEITTAAARGAELTRRLLGYARRQPMNPRPVRFGRLVRAAGAVLRRIIGPGVAVFVDAQRTRWTVQLDGAQFEQVLANLAVNARDAMDGVGQLTFAVDDLRLPPGHADWPEVPVADYVRLRVTDTGCGMSPAVVSRAFEPFFSTKTTGERSGLGLSTCYGIVRQNDGHIRLCSAPGQGTTVEILLPRCPEPAQLDSRIPRSAGLDPSAAVLIVEDETAVRRMACRVLAAAGYTVWSASDAVEALRLVDEGHQPDLVVGDVALTGAGASELVATLRSRWPDLPVLFTTSHADPRVGPHGVRRGGLDFLGKPYTPGALADRVDTLLDGARR